MRLVRGAGEPSRQARIAELIETLHDTEQQLEKLTAGEVDTVVSQDGHVLLLRSAAQQLDFGHLACP